MTGGSAATGKASVFCVAPRNDSSFSPTDSSRKWLTDLPASPATAPAEPRFPIALYLDDRYEILDLLGEEVPRGSSISPTIVCSTPSSAIKVLRPEYSDHPQILEHFRQEIVLSRDLAHPNILRSITGLTRGRRYLTMQWVDGPTLGRIIHEEGALSESVVIHVGLKLAAALAAAHSRKVLRHRDIKPQNVLLDGRRAQAHRLRSGSTARRSRDHRARVSFSVPPTMFRQNRPRPGPSTSARILFSGSSALRDGYRTKALRGRDCG